MNTYTFPENLIQAIAGALNQMPAHQSRGVLNALESTCAQQDQERAQKAEADKREAIKAELKPEIEKAVKEELVAHAAAVAAVAADEVKP